MPALLRSRLAASVLSAAALLSCGNPMGPDDHLEAARRQWSRQGIDSYSFVLREICFCPLEGPFRVTVIRGQVASVVEADTGRPATPRSDVPLTVDALFAVVDDALETADHVEVRYDPALGYPAEIAIDRIRQAVDDEVTYTATDLLPLR